MRNEEALGEERMRKKPAWRGKVLRAMCRIGGRVNPWVCSPEVKDHSLTWENSLEKRKV